MSLNRSHLKNDLKILTPVELLVTVLRTTRGLRLKKKKGCPGCLASTGTGEMKGEGEGMKPDFFCVVSQ
jgi:hypothetical protein